MPQRYATIDAGGRATGFYSDDVHELVPPDAVAVDEDSYLAWIKDTRTQRWDGGALVSCDPPAPPPPALTDYQRAIEALVDATARERSYSSAVSCASYVASTNAAWRAEAEAFVAWRDAVYTAAFAALAAVDGGAPAPSIADFIAALPVIEWPVVPA